MASSLSWGIGFHPLQLPHPEEVVASTSEDPRDDFWAPGGL
jgi:hypothetical protein